MTRIILLLSVLGLAVVARADVSDSGNLTIGGTGVIQGTMTVQGNAFSVGGATFSVAGGSITLGGAMNAASAGIKWADGTISTTASAGSTINALLTATQTFSGANTFISSAVFGAGATKSTFTSTGLLKLNSSGIQWSDGSISNTASLGNAVLNATQTWTGANTFTSSVTAGPLTYISTVATTSGLYVNGWTLVASTNPSAASESTFYGLSRDTTYRLHWKLKKSTDGYWRLRFNGDTSARYYYSIVNENVGTLGASNSAGANLAQLTRASTGSGYFSIGDTIFAGMPSDPTQVYGHSEAMVMISDVNATWNVSSWAWKGLTDISSMTFSNSAGTYTGTLELWAESKPAGATP